MSREMVVGEGGPSPALQVRVEEVPTPDGGLVLVELAGPLTGRTCGQLRDRLQTLIAGSELELLLDLSGVTRIDTAGLGVLVGATRRLQLINTNRRLSFGDETGIVTSAVRRSGLLRALNWPGGHAHEPGTLPFPDHRGGLSG